MTRRCVALLSGGLDSMLAIRVMQLQGVRVQALNFKTLFTCCQTTAAKAARDLGVQLTVATQGDDYLDLIRRPRFGYGRGANPCVDCRIYMGERALRLLEQCEADFVVTGEVLGQRPKSQKRADLEAVAAHSRLNDRLLRPLSALLLPPTLPEREGWVRRDELYGFWGRSRKGLIDLAKQLGLADIPAPSSGCSLTDPAFARRVFELMEQEPAASRWHFELLRVGRHFRHGASKVVLGRRLDENEQLAHMFHRQDAPQAALLWPENFLGPTALLTGSPDRDAMAFVAALIWRFSKPTQQASDDEPRVWVEEGGARNVVPVRPDRAAALAQSLNCGARPRRS